jgi:hypothetical protein
MTSWVMSCRSHPLHPINSCMPQFLHYFLTRVLTPSLMRSNWTSQWLLNLSFSLALLSLSFFPPFLFLPRALTLCPLSHALQHLSFPHSLTHSLTHSLSHTPFLCFAFFLFLSFSLAGRRRN